MIKYKIYTIVIIFCAFAQTFAEGLSLFPKHQKLLSAQTLPYSQMLHFGTESDTTYMRGRFGVDFPVVGYDFESEQKIIFGINAAAHINMRPNSNMTVYPVDNFYAVLALYFSGTFAQDFSWRLYPIYHVSAHLADGYPTDILKENVHAVSSEMVKGEIYYDLFNNLLELGFGAGWYYHVCAQKDLTHMAQMTILITPPRVANNLLQPFALLRGELVHQKKYHPGTDISAGIFAIRENRGLGIALRYFNRLHTSYYFEEYEKGFGTELMFLF